MISSPSFILALRTRLFFLTHNTVSQCTNRGSCLYFTLLNQATSSKYHFSLFANSSPVPTTHITQPPPQAADAPPPPKCRGWTAGRGPPNPRPRPRPTTSSQAAKTRLTATRAAASSAPSVTTTLPPQPRTRRSSTARAGAAATSPGSLIVRLRVCLWGF